MTDLYDKVVVVTGAANGLGKALAMEFYREGCHLALLDVDGNGLQQLKSGIEKSGQRISIHAVDIADKEKMAVTKTNIIQAHQRIDILVNNAGISISQPLEQMDLVDFKNLFAVNFWGTVYCTQLFLPELKKQKDSRLVNIISDFALMGFPGKTAYGSSKAAVMGFTNTLKTELAATNVKPCLVIPPPLNTAIVKNGKHIDDDKKAKEVRFLEKNGWPLDKTAKRIVKQVKKGKYRIIIGSMMFWIDLMARLFPTMLHRLVGRNKDRFDFV